MQNRRQSSPPAVFRACKHKELGELISEKDAAGEARQIVLGGKRHARASAGVLAKNVLPVHNQQRAKLGKLSAIAANFDRESCRGPKEAGRNEISDDSPGGWVVTARRMPFLAGVAKSLRDGASTPDGPFGFATRPCSFLRSNPRLTREAQKSVRCHDTDDVIKVVIHRTESLICCDRWSPPGDPAGGAARVGVVRLQAFALHHHAVSGDARAVANGRLVQQNGPHSHRRRSPITIGPIFSTRSSKVCARYRPFTVASVRMSSMSGSVQNEDTS